MSVPGRIWRLGGARVGKDGLSEAGLDRRGERNGWEGCGGRKGEKGRYG